MMLDKLIEDLSFSSFTGDKGLEIEGVQYDSRLIRPGHLFVAVKGHDLDGHTYIQDAIKNGAVAVVTEKPSEIGKDIAEIRVQDSRKSLSKLAARFYGDPCKDLRIIGITGTNGKTTTSYIIESILEAANKKPGVIGTVNYRFAGKEYPTAVTTPESLDLMRIIREMANDGVSHVVLEVSSHALQQGRTGDCHFNTAIFTNLSRDHLDYHNTMEEYFQAKSILFRELHLGRKEQIPVAVINADDPKGEELKALTKTETLTYGLLEDAQVKAKNISTDKEGIRATLAAPSGEIEIGSGLIGEVNIYNILAAASAALSMGIGLEEISGGIRKLKAVPGRLEKVPNNKGLAILVDYAHTPDALLKAQKTVRPLTEGRLITVFGCGGNRDRGKRYEMGLSAGQNSDIVIITSDNPRNENPEAIIEQIENGIYSSGLPKASESELAETGKGYIIEADRRKAIRQAVAMAGSRDTILIAGKGHEDYQIIGNEKKHFDDREEAAIAAG